MHTPTPKQLAAAAAYVSQLEANLVAANDEVARLRIKAADRDQWQEVAMKVSAERDRLRTRYAEDSRLLSALNDAIMRAPLDAKISDLLPGKWTDVRQAIQRNLIGEAA